MDSEMQVIDKPWGKEEIVEKKRSLYVEETNNV